MNSAGRCIRVVTGALILCSGTLLADADYSIGYHETIDNLFLAEKRSSAAGSGTTTLSVYAFEQQLVMELESNPELTSSMKSGRDGAGTSAYARSNRFEALLGKLQGVDDSWVRLTRSGNSITGVIWNGERLLAIEPYSRVREMVSDTEANGTDHVIYDVDDMIPMKGQSCAVEGVGSSHGGSYGSLVKELRKTPARRVSSQLNVAFITDEQFASANSGDVDAAVIARLNIIEGVFSQQVGVKINATEIRKVGSSAGLNSSSASTLLNELRSYSRAEMTNPGLVHLLTGRDLDGGTVGIAYISALCSQQAGYGLTQADGNTSVVVSALTAAHELGHNFGAPHDNQSGSACASSAGGRLMAPRLNGSSTFSQCSLNQIEPVVERASCTVAVGRPEPAPAPTPAPTPTPEPAPEPGPAPVPGPIVLAADFNDNSTEGFSYRHDPFGLGNKPEYQSGGLVTTGGVSRTGALRVLLGGLDNEDITGMSGGVVRTFDLSSQADITVTFKAQLTQTFPYERDERSDIYASFDGEFLPGPEPTTLVTVRGNGNFGGDRTTGFRTYRFELDGVSAGQHELIIGGFNNKKTEHREVTEILVDDVLVETRGNRVSTR